MKRLFTAVVMLAVCACGLPRADGADEFRNGVPASGAVELKVPGATQQPLTGEGTKRDGLEGDTAAFYGFTRGVTVLVNTGVAATLILVEKITEYPPTTTTATSATWGPHTDALSPNTWRLTVKQLAPSQFSYSLDGSSFPFRSRKAFWCVSQPRRLICTMRTPASTNRRATRKPCPHSSRPYKSRVRSDSCVRSNGLYLPGRDAKMNRIACFRCASQAASDVVRSD